MKDMPKMPIYHDKIHSSSMSEKRVNRVDKEKDGKNGKNGISSTLAMMGNHSIYSKNSVFPIVSCSAKNNKKGIGSNNKEKLSKVSKLSIG